MKLTSFNPHFEYIPRLLNTCIYLDGGLEEGFLAAVTCVYHPPPSFVIWSAWRTERGTFSRRPSATCSWMFTQELARTLKPAVDFPCSSRSSDGSVHFSGWCSCGVEAAELGGEDGLFSCQCAAFKALNNDRAAYLFHPHSTPVHLCFPIVLVQHQNLYLLV